jgi:DNA-binding IclR family transcriptional regulator
MVNVSNYAERLRKGSAAVAAPTYPLYSVDRALSLIFLLGERKALRVQDVARDLGVAASTAHRLLAMLVHHGFAVVDLQHVYRPGPALEMVHTDAHSPGELFGKVKAHLEALAAATGETVHLVTLEGTGTRFIGTVEAARPTRVHTRTGKVLPAHLTAGGKALLARLSREEIYELYPQGLRLRSEAAGPQFASLLRELALTRRRGYGMNVEGTEHGVSAVGAAIVHRSGRGIAAISVSALSERTPYRRCMELGEQVVDAAHTISELLLPRVVEQATS